MENSGEKLYSLSYAKEAFESRLRLILTDPVIYCNLTGLEPGSIMGEIEWIKSKIKEYQDHDNQRIEG